MGKTEFVPLTEAADEIGLSLRQVRHLCSQGKLGTKMGKHWVITRGELNRFIDKPRRGPGRPATKKKKKTTKPKPKSKGKKK